MLRAAPFLLAVILTLASPVPAIAGEIHWNSETATALIQYAD